LAVATLILIVEQLLHPNIKLPGTVIIVLIIIITIGGFIRDKKLITTHLILKSPKLKTDYTVVFVSDLHVDLIHSQRYLRKLINKILLENPDLVLIGGDLINIPHERYLNYFSEFQRIKVPIYAVIGNHDIYFGPDTHLIEKIFQKGNMHPLRNTTTQRKDLQLVGIDDKELRDKKKLNAIIEQCNIPDNGKYTIFLTHRPIRLSKLATTPIDLELAGHTHKGQVRGLHFLSRIVNDYTYGKYSYTVPPARGEGAQSETKGGREAVKKVAFVSQGTGTRTPFRIGTEGEIVVLHLEAK
jgi:predicted MPP superfamily phosphohydrolase